MQGGPSFQPTYAGAFSIVNSLSLISSKLASEFGFQLIEERRRKALMAVREICGGWGILAYRFTGEAASRNAA
jgi:hypothetical protein